MAFPARRLDIIKRQHRLLPVFTVPVGILKSGGSALALMADGTAKFFKWMKIRFGMVSERFFFIGKTRVLHSRVACNAPVNLSQFYNCELSYANRERGRQFLIKSILVSFPLSEIILGR